MSYGVRLPDGSIARPARRNGNTPRQVERICPVCLCGFGERAEACKPCGASLRELVSPMDRSEWLVTTVEEREEMVTRRIG